MRPFLRDFDELRPNPPRLFSLLLINERTNDDVMMMMMPWCLECFSLPFIVQVFPPLWRLSYRQALSPIRGIRHASKIRIESAASCLRVRKRVSVCVRCVVHQTHPIMRNPKNKLHTLLYENASSPETQRDPGHARHGTGTRCWGAVVS